MNSINPFFAFFKKRDASAHNFFMPFIRRVKMYENAIHIPLPATKRMLPSLEETITHRKSGTNFAQEALPMSDLSTILYWSVAELKPPSEQKAETRQGQKVRRPHPSGGGKYPIETYLCFDQETDAYPRGLYHYRPDVHAIELVQKLDRSATKGFKQALSSYIWVERAPVVMLFSFILERGVSTYGSLAYKLGLIEAGHIAQNMYLLNAALDLQCCALGNFNEALAHRCFFIDGYNETFFYALAMGLKRKNKGDS